MERFATICHTLTQLTVKGVRFVWNEECEQAYQQLKGALAAAVVLAYPNPQVPMLLDTDASGVGLGTVLSHRDAADREWVLVYASWALTQPKWKCITRRELLGVVFGIRKFCAYLAGPNSRCAQTTAPSDGSSAQLECR